MKETFNSSHEYERSPDAKDFIEPNETQPWRRELPLHREGVGTLNPEEVLALIGSFTESSLGRHKDDNEAGELTDQQFSVKQRVHAAALEQLRMLGVDESTNALNAIADRREELKTILKTPHMPVLQNKQNNHSQPKQSMTLPRK